MTSSSLHNSAENEDTDVQLLHDQELKENQNLEITVSDGVDCAADAPYDTKNDDNRCSSKVPMRYSLGNAHEDKITAPF